MAWRTLVVDDDIVLSMSLSISDEEVVVTDVSRAADGFNAALAGQFDVAIIDRRLPDGDGLDLVRRLRSMLDMSELPIIVLTAGYDPADLDEVMHAGANEYLAKPIEPAELVAACRRVGSVPETDAALKKHRKPGRFRRRDRDRESDVAETPVVRPRIVEDPIETTEQTMRRQRAASDTRAAHAYVEVQDLQGMLAAVRAERDELQSALDQDADERVALATRNQTLEDELGRLRVQLGECLDRVEEQDGVIHKLRSEVERLEEKVVDALPIAPSAPRKQQSAAKKKQAARKRRSR